MAKQKVSLEEILNEYSNENNKKTSGSDNEVRDILMNHNRNNHINDGTRRRPNPANDYKPSDIGKPDISFINSIGIDRLRSPQNKSNISVYDGASVTQISQDSDDYIPKIRRMSDSTRAREIQKIKKNKFQKKSDFTYKRESPEGEYIYSSMPERNKKKKKFSLSPQSVNDGPIAPAPGADLKNPDKDFTFDSDSLDIHIEHGTKNISDDFNCYDDAREISNNIRELKKNITLRFTMLLVCAILSVFITFLPSLSADKSPMKFTAFQIIIGMASLIISAPVITNGLKKLIRFKPDSDSASAVTAVTVIISAIIAFFTPELVKNGSVNIYIPAAVLSLLFNSIGKFLIIRRAERNFKVISKKSEKYGITCVTDDIAAETLTRSTMTDFPILASMHKTAFLSDFLKYTYSSDISDKFCRRSIPASIIISLLSAGFMTAIHQKNFGLNTISFGLSILSMLICASSCIGMTLVSNIPLNNVSKKVIKNKGIIFGYQSIDDFYDTNSILTEAKDLFPEISVKLAGIKVFSDTKIDEAMLEAASLTHHAGSIMKGLFDDVIIGKEDSLYNIENFSYEDSLGLCGWINNKRVLFGSRELMTGHNIEGMPTKAKENELTDNGKEAVYLSVSGNLSAMFVVELKAESNIKYWINQLYKNNVHIIIKSVDSCITLKRLSQIFGIPEEFMRIIPKKLHAEFDQQTKKSAKLSASMACSGRFSEFAQLIMASKAIHSSSVAGLIIQTISILLGIGLGIVMIASNAFGYSGMSSPALILYNLAFAGVTFLTVNIKKF